MQRYFVEKKENDLFILNDDDSHHTKNVMRYKIGNKLEIVFNNKLYIASIETFDPTTCKIIEETEEENELKTHITIAQSLVKEQKMDYILQKNTELGASSFIPVATTRSVVKIKKGDKKITRWQKILKEASEQSKRVKVPDMHDVITIKELAKIEGYDLKLLFTLEENSKNLKKVLTNSKTCAKMIIVVGPEGGFTKEEEQILIENGFISTSLGSSVLRTETAGIFLTSIIRYIDMEL